MYIAHIHAISIVTLEVISKYIETIAKWSTFYNIFYAFYWNETNLLIFGLIVYTGNQISFVKLGGSRGPTDNKIHIINSLI